MGVPGMSLTMGLCILPTKLQRYLDQLTTDTIANCTCTAVLDRYATFPFLAFGYGVQQCHFRVAEALCSVMFTLYSLLAEDILGSRGQTTPAGTRNLRTGAIPNLLVMDKISTYT